MALCCLVDNEIVVCSVCDKSAGKTKNQLTLAECKQWYVKRGDPIYCKKCLVNEKIRLKRELETLKAINAMQNKKKTSKLKVIEQTKRAEKRAQSKKDIKQNRKDNFSYDLRKELEVRRKLGRIERLQEGGQRSNLQKRRRSSIVEFFKKIGTNAGGHANALAQQQQHSAGDTQQGARDSEGAAGGAMPVEAKARRRRRSSIVDFFKKFAAPKASNRKSGFKNKQAPATASEHGISQEWDKNSEVELEDCIITPVNSNPNTPRQSFDDRSRPGGNDGDEFADVLTIEDESISIEDTLDVIGEREGSLRESFCSDHYDMNSISEDSVSEAKEIDEAEKEKKVVRVIV